MTQTRRDFLILSSLAGASWVLQACGVPEDRREAEPTEPAPEAFSPSLWLAFHPDGAVELRTTKLEMGQGIETTLAILVAEELAIDPGRFHLRTPSTAELPNAGKMLLTGGSASTSRLWLPVRTAAAAAREMLIAAAAERWGVAADSCTLRDGGIHHPPSGRRLEHTEILEAASSQPVPEDPPLHDPADFRFIGRPRPRLDGLPTVTGRTRFASDLRFPGQLFAVLARPPVPGGKAVSFDPTGALTVPGVERVLALGPSVAVVASDTWSALRGRDALEVSWDEGRGARFSSRGFDGLLEEALDREVEPRYRRLHRTVVATAREEGDEPHLLGPPSLEAEYATPFQTHVPMEPWNAVARFEEDRCEVWCGHQIPHRVVRDVASHLGLPEDEVIVHSFPMGGAFGLKEHTAYPREAAELARAFPGRPVQVFWSREDDIRNTLYHPASRHRLQGWLDEGGSIAGWRHRLAIPSTERQWGTRPSLLVRGASSGAWNLPYAFPRLRVEYADPPIPVPLGFWRGIVIQINAFAVESFVDELAAAADRDPLDLRLEHLTTTVESIGAEGPFAVSRLGRALDLVAERSGWGTPLPAGRGRGLAATVFDGRTAVASVAEVTVRDGSLSIDRIACVLDCGVVVNPLGLASNAEGAVAWGLSALFSEITFKRGRVQQSSHLDYPILRMSQMPAVEIHTVPSDEPPSGVGEIPVPTVAPAVTNAIFQATGRRIRRLPIRPEDLS